MASALDPSEILNRLQPTPLLNPDLILLDPNNPRLAEARGAKEPEDCLDDPRVQEDTFRRIRGDKGGEVGGDIDDLRGSIAMVGYLPITMLVVRKHFKPGSNKYVVIEGNRRIAAIKWILREAPPGLTGNLLKKRRKQLQKLQLIELETDLNRLDRDRLLLQGICHMSPPRSWPAFSRAFTCDSLYSRGLNATKVSRALGGGIKPREVGRLVRSFRAYRQMLNDDEYNDYAEKNPKLISYFSEVIGRRRLRDSWLGWDDDQHRFTDEENTRTLYELFASGKIRRETDIRLLPKILDFYPSGLDKLVEDEEYTIENAYAEAIRVEQERVRPPPPIPWRVDVRATIRTLTKGVSLPFYEDDVDLLETLITRAKERLRDIKRSLGIP